MIVVAGRPKFLSLSKGKNHEGDEKPENDKQSQEDPTSETKKGGLADVPSARLVFAL